MTPTIHTFGYTGRSLADLQTLCEAVDGCVVDVRYVPRSRNPTWSRKRLQEALGDRYAWIQQFGNLNYRSVGPIVLAAFEDGCGQLRAILDSGRHPILLCACGEAPACHRTEVARRLAERFYLPIAPGGDER